MKPGDVIGGANRNFASLSLKDLLAARDQYHFHLMNKANVVGTAVGRYLIRTGETSDAMSETSPEPKKARTFWNSTVREYSWPCVIVVVENWVRDFATGSSNVLHPEQFVPKTLYLPDGRMVPVCIVEAKPLPQQLVTLPSWVWPSGKLAPGYPVSVTHQRVDRIASVGCLVTDGHTTYALTNRHVAGVEGSPVYTWRRHRRERIGLATDKQLTRVEFDRAYPEYPCRRTYLNADVGLVALDDLNQWTSDVFELGPVGELVDLHEANLGLGLIDAKVSAHGAASGQLSGTIKGLFYRYKSVGGYDYVADFLIAPLSIEDSNTQEGDSGTVWHLENTTKSDGEAVIQRLPLAIEWGAQAIGGTSGGRANFALATSLATVCRLLDVELVRDVDRGATPTWGQMGHYTVGAYATTALTNANLSKLMKANLEHLSFKDANLDPKKMKAIIAAVTGNTGMVPLADVPDLVWKHLPQNMVGGRDTSGGQRSTGPEHPTHYADIDEPNQQRNDQTLLEACLDGQGNVVATNVTVTFWQQFYDECGHTTFDKRGLLPFRVWQFYDAMVDALKAKDVDKYICAAGLVAHYVGDASQPLHGSMFSNGYTNKHKTITVHHDNGTVEQVQSHQGDGVHSCFESHMLEHKDIFPDVVAGIKTAMTSFVLPSTTMNNGQDVAVEILKLMQRSAKALAPRTLVDFYIANGDKDSVAMQKKMWAKFKDKTLERLADSAKVLAKLWEAAWVAGNGDANINAAELKVRKPSDLRALYENPAFVESMDLDNIGTVLK